VSDRFEGELERAFALGHANRKTMELARRHCLDMAFPLVDGGGRGLAAVQRSADRHAPGQLPGGAGQYGRDEQRLIFGNDTMIETNQRLGVSEHVVSQVSNDRMTEKGHSWRPVTATRSHVVYESWLGRRAVLAALQVADRLGRACGGDSHIRRFRFAGPSPMLHT
jgi:hypothetical protein